MYTKLKYLSLLIFIVNAVVTTTTTYKCCAPDQWEGQITMDLNQIPYLINMNVTADVAYDYTNSIAFLNVTGFISSFFDSKPQFVSSLYIEDYINKIEYDVDYGKNCTKGDISGSVMTRQCIKGNDTLLYSGMVGNGIMTDTYNTSLNDNFNYVKATVQRGTCLPVHLAYIISDTLALMSVNVFNITPGIKDRKIFETPPQCKKNTLEHKKTKKEEQSFKSILRDVLKRKLLFGRIKS